MKVERRIPWGDEPNNIACVPIYSRLPAYHRSYRLWGDTDEADLRENGDISRWLTRPYDELACELRAEIEGFYVNFLDPETARPTVLDWLAMHLGFTGEFWDASWPDSVKRAILGIADAIWSGAGSVEVLNDILEALEVPTCTDVFPFNTTGHEIYRLPWLRADIGTTDFAYRYENTQVWVRMPFETTVRGDEYWQRAQFALDNFLPTGANGTVCWCEFRADVSNADDGYFDIEWERTRPVVDDWFAANPGVEDDDPVDVFARLLAHLLAHFEIAGRVVQVFPFRADISGADDILWDVVAQGHPDPENAIGQTETSTEYDPAPTVFVVVETSITKDSDTWYFIKRMIEWYRPWWYFDPAFMIGYGVFIPELSPANSPVLANTVEEIEALDFVTA